MSPLDPAKQSAAQERAILQRPEGGPRPAASTATDAQSEYAGLVTRTIAFALDCAIINGVALLVSVAVGLGLSVLQISGQAKDVMLAIGGAVWIAWSLGYFVFFWSSTGVTPGDRLMRIRVIDARGRGTLHPVRATARFGYLVLATLPLGAGLLIMLWDERSRCLQDRLAHTVVVFAPVTDAAGHAPSVADSSA